MTTLHRPRYKNIVLHIPHASAEGAASAGWKDAELLAAQVRLWTDWFTDERFDVPCEGVCAVRFPLSRFV